MLKKKINKAMLKAFIQRKRINALGLIIITAVSALFTLAGALTGFSRTNILVIITVLMIALCLVQLIRNGKGFRTLRSCGELHKKSRSAEPD